VYSNVRHYKLSQQLVQKQGACPLVDRVSPVLIDKRHTQLRMFVGKTDDEVGIGQRRSHRLFAKHMLVGPQGVDNHLEMERRRSANAHNVDFGIR
jgi:hypothetical protein